MDDIGAIRPRFRPRPGDLAAAVVATAVLIGVWWLIGEGIVHSPTIVDTDESVSRWFADHRGSVVDALTWFGSELGDTIVKIVVTVIATGWAWRRFRRWQEPTMIAAPLAIEATTFIVVTHLVDRPRPDVPPLETSFVHSSFPSGHVAAAAVYGGIAMVIAWHTRSRRVEVAAFVTVALITLAVAVSRVWRGMHHLSDVLAGALLGVVCVVVVARRMRAYVPDAQVDRALMGRQPGAVPIVAGSTDGVNTSPAYPASAHAASRRR